MNNLIDFLIRSAKNFKNYIWRSINFTKCSLRCGLFFIISISFLFPTNLKSQIVIGGAEPDNSAILDLQSTSRGFLMPRLTQSQRDSIDTPAGGLQIFNSSTTCVEINFGTSANPIWIQTDCLGQIDSLLCDSPTLSYGLTVATPISDQILSNILYTGGNGGSFPSVGVYSSGVEGVTAHLFRGEFQNGMGELVFQISGMALDTGIATIKVELGGKECEINLEIKTGLVDELICEKTIYSGFFINSQYSDSIIASLPYSGGNGGPYPGDTFEIVGLTGLFTDSFFNRGAGSIHISFSGTPSETGLWSVPLEIGGHICQLEGYVYDTVVPYPKGYVHCNPGYQTEVNPVMSPTGKTWMDRNLGATRVALNSNDGESFGSLFQWGRFADGHQCRNSLTTATKATTAIVDTNHVWYGRFVTVPTFSRFWMTSVDTTLWQKENDINNPCPSGYRLPTNSEWEEETQSWQNPGVVGGMESPLKLPRGGHRNDVNGYLYAHSGIGGAYWTGSVYGSVAIWQSSTVIGTNFPSQGQKVRCIRD